ncbi:hypothetical protein CEE45_01740 [Candidatus Heimdallarchaeota archaeon B3_Heim]|nr:MAG: hypothetical protein CEE45_01740 [Candidatus Heimdallarchaeota archaeon B3_Heim]
MHTIFKTFFDYCITNALYLDSNPLELLKRRKGSKTLPNPFTASQVEIIMRKCPPSHRFMHELLLNTGIRLDELCHLKFTDFDSERKILHVRNRSSGGGAKGDKARDIPVTDLLLKKYQTFLVDYRLKAKTKSDIVFISRKNRPIVPRSVQSRMFALRDKLSFRIHAHRYRTTFATNLHKDGVSIFTIALLMGHEDISTTQNYILVTLDEQRRAISQGTPLGKQELAVTKIEQLNREKQDLVALVDNLIQQNETLLQRIRSLNI